MILSVAFAAVAFSTGIPETSGLAWRTIDGRRQIVAVADEVMQIAIADVTEKKNIKFVKRDLSRLLGRKNSGWEAVAADGEGNICMLREEPATLECVNAKLDAVLARVKLKLDAQPNSGPEGLVLLKNGHILVAKEKDDPQLIEMGPPGKAAGYAPGDAVEGEFKFPLVKEFVALKTWDLGEESSELAWDLSELQVGPEGRLYILSDDSQVIGALEKRLPPESRKLRITETYDVAAAQPEGMLLGWDGDDTQCLVADDEKFGRNNLSIVKLTKR